ncbi:hypothetical protein CHLRE_08g368150v5 [Chlamydomonas reinhardtii]|uniref:Protein kinase domain-containing protein n=1 Tax=Chlamydomonas reinhardtii TaxID=3055 RepID=A0A2K3DGZ8_CHLRE|nr:uncharacterized protein CHLRE_08g368150v5 [Chlamydomonas reinhardtii]PNW79823.1 hypothetical protein CHLRE_08g368150v5 [Chlamydomonas reinhardtii]
MALGQVTQSFELNQLTRHLGQSCVDCWEVTERQSATASAAAASFGLAAAASGTATTTSSRIFEAAVKTCALDLEGLAAGGSTPQTVAVHAKEAAAALAVQALDSRHLVKVARESLTDVVKGHPWPPRLPEAAVRVVLASMLLGLRDLMHGRARLAHRDLKLHNLLIGKDRLVKIADFGLVTPLDNQGRLAVLVVQCPGCPVALPGQSR